MKSSCIVGILIFFMVIPTATAESATWWDGEWLYRTPITVTSTSGNLTNYQIKVDINLTEYIDNEYMNETGKDIRFVNTTNHELDFWIETLNVTGENSTIWVKVPELINETATTIYMYFGNSHVDSVSNGTKTFDFFDNFETGSLDSKWNVPSTNYVVSDGILRVNAGGIGLENPLNFNIQDGYMVETKILFNLLENAYSGTIPEISSSRFTAGSNGNSDANILYMRNTNSRVVNYWAGNGAAASYNLGSGSTGWTSAEDIWYLTGLSVEGGSSGSTAKIWRDGTDLVTFSSVTWAKNIRYISLGYFSGGTANAQDTSYDWVRIRKYSTIEPSVSVGEMEFGLKYNNISLKGEETNSNWLTPGETLNITADVWSAEDITFLEALIWNPGNDTLNPDNADRVTLVNLTTPNNNSIWTNTTYDLTTEKGQYFVKFNATSSGSNWLSEEFWTFMVDNNSVVLVDWQVSEIYSNQTFTVTLNVTEELNVSVALLEMKNATTGNPIANVTLIYVSKVGNQINMQGIFLQSANTSENVSFQLHINDTSDNKYSTGIVYRIVRDGYTPMIVSYYHSRWPNPYDLDPEINITVTIRDDYGIKSVGLYYKYGTKLYTDRPTLPMTFVTSWRDPENLNLLLYNYTITGFQNEIYSQWKQFITDYGMSSYNSAGNEWYYSFIITDKGASASGFIQDEHVNDTRGIVEGDFKIVDTQKPVVVSVSGNKDITLDVDGLELTVRVYDRNVYAYGTYGNQLGISSVIIGLNSTPGFMNYTFICSFVGLEGVFPNERAVFRNQSSGILLQSLYNIGVYDIIVFANDSKDVMRENQEIYIDSVKMKFNDPDSPIISDVTLIDGEIEPENNATIRINISDNNLLSLNVTVYTSSWTPIHIQIGPNDTSITGDLRPGVYAYFIFNLTDIGDYYFVINATDAAGSIYYNSSDYSKKITVRTLEYTLSVNRTPIELATDALIFNLTVLYNPPSKPISGALFELHLTNGSILGNFTAENMTTVDWYYIYGPFVIYNHTGTNSYNVKVYVNDSDGVIHTTTEENLFTVVDTTAPNILAFETSLGEILPNQNSIATVNVSDYSNNYSSMLLRINSTTYGPVFVSPNENIYSGNGNYTFNVSIPQEGVYDLRVSVADRDGNEITQMIQITVTEVSFSSLDKNASMVNVNVDPIRLNVTVTKVMYDIYSVLFEVRAPNGIRYNYTTTMNESDVFYVDISPFDTLGTYNFSVYANDTEGRVNKYIGADAQFIVNDTIAPVIELVPQEAVILPNDEIIVTVTISDASNNISYLKLYVNDSSGILIYTVDPNRTVADAGVYHFNFTLTVVGHYNLTVVVSDQVNTNTTVFREICEVRDVDIQLFISDVINKPTVEFMVENITFTAEVRRPVLSVSNVTITLANSTHDIQTWYALNNTEYENNYVNWSIHYGIFGMEDNLSIGTYYLRVYANDTKRVVNFNFTFNVVDTIAPKIHSITIDPASKIAFPSQNITVTVNVSDESQQFTEIRLLVLNITSIDPRDVFQVSERIVIDLLSPNEDLNGSGIYTFNFSTLSQVRDYTIVLVVSDLSNTNYSNESISVREVIVGIWTNVTTSHFELGFKNAIKISAETESFYHGITTLIFEVTYPNGTKSNISAYNITSSNKLTVDFEYVFTDITKIHYPLQNSDTYTIRAYVTDNRTEPRTIYSTNYTQFIVKDTTRPNIADFTISQKVTSELVTITVEVIDAGEITTAPTIRITNALGVARDEEDMVKIADKLYQYNFTLTISNTQLADSAYEDFLGTWRVSIHVRDSVGNEIETRKVVTFSVYNLSHKDWARWWYLQADSAIKSSATLIDVNKYNQRLAEVQTLIDQGEYDVAIALANKIIEDIQSEEIKGGGTSWTQIIMIIVVIAVSMSALLGIVKSRHKAEDIQKEADAAIGTVIELIDERKEYGFETLSYVNAIDEARKQFDLGEFQKTKEMMIQLEEELGKKAAKMREAYNVMTHVKDEVLERGITTPKAEKIYSEAKDAYKKEEFERAIELAKKSEEEASKGLEGRTVFG